MTWKKRFQISPIRHAGPLYGPISEAARATSSRPNSKIWIPDITGPPGVKTKLILDLGLVSEAPWSTLGGGANKKIWFFGLEFYFFFLAWFSEDIAPGGHTEACSSLRPK